MLKEDGHPVFKGHDFNQIPWNPVKSAVDNPWSNHVFRRGRKAHPDKAEKVTTPVKHLG